MCFLTGLGSHTKEESEGVPSYLASFGPFNKDAKPPLTSQVLLRRPTFATSLDCDFFRCRWPELICLASRFDRTILRPWRKLPIHDCTCYIMMSRMRISIFPSLARSCNIVYYLQSLRSTLIRKREIPSAIFLKNSNFIKSLLIFLIENT